MAFDVNSERAKRAQAEWVATSLGIPLAGLAKLRDEQAQLDRLASAAFGPIAGALAGQVPCAGQLASPQPLVIPPAVHLAEPPQPAAGTKPAKRPPAAHWFKDARAHPLTYWLRRLAVQRGCNELAAAKVWCGTLRLPANLNRLVVCHDGQAQRITGDLAADQPSKEDGKHIAPKPDPELAERARAHVGLAIGRALAQAFESGSLQAFDDLAWLGHPLALTAADAEALFPELREAGASDAGVPQQNKAKRRPVGSPVPGLPVPADLWREVAALKVAKAKTPVPTVAKKYGCCRETIRLHLLAAPQELKSSGWNHLIKVASRAV